jgi:hypothetical protein
MLSQSLPRQHHPWCPIRRKRKSAKPNLQLLALGLFSQISVEKQKEALHLGIERLTDQHQAPFEQFRSVLAGP